MSIFAIISPQESNDKLEAAIKALIPENNIFKVFSNQWLVCAGGTSQELSIKLGINKDDADNTGPAIVVSVASYWGRANPQIWEWIGINWNKDCG
ncbi:MAG: hypothetical protein WCF59_09515 [Desulfobaccales bacterium]